MSVNFSEKDKNKNTDGELEPDVNLFMSHWKYLTELNEKDKNILLAELTNKINAYHDAKRQFLWQEIRFVVVLVVLFSGTTLFQNATSQLLVINSELATKMDVSFLLLMAVAMYGLAKQIEITFDTWIEKRGIKGKIDILAKQLDFTSLPGYSAESLVRVKRSFDSHNQDESSEDSWDALLQKEESAYLASLGIPPDRLSREKEPDSDEPDLDAIESEANQDQSSALQQKR